MIRVHCEENWRTVNRIIPDWANELGEGTREADLSSDMTLAFKGLLDDGGALTNRSGYFLFDKVQGRLLSPIDPQLWLYLRALADCIFLSKEAVNDLARRCKRSSPSWCSDVTKGASQPSRPQGQPAPAPMAMIIEEIRSAYDRAEATGEKPPNVKEISPVVQHGLRQNGHRASRRQIEKLAEAEEFKCRRWPPGKRQSEPRKK
jgi:hypothetical protein